ncbi:MAG: NAD(P)/FAD-dependent oxidoreductase [Acidobacteriaceae bacterium]
MPTTWYDDKPGPIYPKLSGSAKAEVVVIGGGMAGIWTAYLLSDKHKVILIEADELGSGATIDTTAFVTQLIDTSADELIKLFGEERTKKIYASGFSGIEAIASAIKKEGIECEFEDATTYVYAAEADQYPAVEKEYEALISLGLKPKIHQTHELKLASFGHYELIGQAKFHPLKFLHGLAHAAVKKGALIYEKTEALGIQSDHQPFTVKTTNGDIAADFVVVTTYNPFNKPHEVFAKKGMYKSYVLEVELPEGRLPPGIYWDKADPYNYFRIDKRPGFDRMILGGQDHRYGLPVDREKRFKLLEEYLQKLLPENGYKIKQKWAGPILEPSDGLPLIGKYREGQLLAAGFSGNGMTYSPISAMIFRDIIEGRNNDWLELYDPDRLLKPYRLLMKGEDYAEKFFNGVIKNFFKG